MDFVITASTLRRAAAPLAIIGSLLALAAPSGAAPRSPLPPVHVRGTVYTFDNQEPIPGATVRVVQFPGLSATTGPDGTYDLAVPDGREITLYAEAAGHHALHTQTFVTHGRDLEHVNHQDPTTGTYHALAGLMSVQLDANDNPTECVVVSTFSTMNVRDVSFQQFVDYGAHGVAGATAYATPSLPSPVYFNESVIPDRTRTESSVDGGVIWTHVPAGTYRFHGQSPNTRFASFRADCEPGRVVNANPPQGLYELRPGEAVDSTVDAKLAKPRVNRKGSSLKAKVKGGEYVSAVGDLFKGRKRIAHRDPGIYLPGAQTLNYRLGEKLAGRKLRLVVTLTDPEGNTKVLRRKVRVPVRR